MPQPEPILIGAVLLLAGVVAGKVSGRLGIPALILFLGIGMLAGSDGPGGIDFNDADIFGGYGESVTFALNWWWTANARMQMNYILGEIKDRDVNGGAPIELVSGDYQILGTRFMYFY